MAKIENDRIVFDESDFGGISINLFNHKINLKAPYQELFKWAYRRHDYQYQFFKNSNDLKAREMIDKELLEDMINICKSKNKNYILPYCYTAYATVRVLGGFVWSNKNNAL